jgi:hypothetical protein
MERATRRLVVAWACAAVAAEAWLLRGWSLLPFLTLGAFLTGAALTLFRRSAVGVVLAFAYTFPAVIWLVRGLYHDNYSIVWMAAILGAIAPDGLRTGWHLPARWRGPLVFSCLVCAISACVVVAREIDFNTLLLLEPRLPSSALGSVPGFVAAWVIQVALTLVLGILWFDWLFGAGLDVDTAIARPLGISFLVMAAVAIYQMFVDVWFMNATVFGGTGRASGTMFDANVCGAIAALWSGGAVLIADRTGRWRPYVTAAGMATAWLVVWATSSRTALASASLVTAIAAIGLRSRREGSPGLNRRTALVAAGSAVAIVVLLAQLDLGVVGPLQRVRASFPGWSWDSLRIVAGEAWDRNGYGATATWMLRESPLFGFGVGIFHQIVGDFAGIYSGARLPPDNAQNWYRHQLVEFGLIGSLGWIIWVVSFGRFVLTDRPGFPSRAWAARGMLIALALVSLLGMPSQTVSVMMTFWTAAFWYVSLVGAPGPAAPLAPRSWAAILGIALVFAIGTVHLATTSLRVPVRATRVGWPYSYGFYFAEPDGRGGEQRWARQRAAAVVEATGPWLELTVGVNHYDIERRPVEARVWRDGELVLDERLTTTAPVTRLVPVPDGHRYVVIDTWVSRVVRPKDLGIEDGRELGLLVKWNFRDVRP